jgi:hypothetical protein
MVVFMSGDVPSKYARVVSHQVADGWGERN